MTSRTSTVDLNDIFSYLCLYLEDDLQNVYMNFKQINESYVDTFENICQCKYPESVTLSLMDVQYKEIVDMIRVYHKESLDKISFKIYDKDTLAGVHPELFEEY